jgi:hypothetical protein
MLIPIAFPRSPGGNAEVIIARLVPKIIALEIPCSILRTMSDVMLCEKRIRKVETVNNEIPAVKTFFLPIMSASRPNGRRKIADERMKLLITQPRLMAFAFRSFPIAGRARFTAEPRKED